MALPSVERYGRTLSNLSTDDEPGIRPVRVFDPDTGQLRRIIPPTELGRLNKYRTAPAAIKQAREPIPDLNMRRKKLRHGRDWNA
jgi:hypothetical protein